MAENTASGATAQETTELASSESSYLEALNTDFDLEEPDGKAGVQAENAPETTEEPAAEEVPEEEAEEAAVDETAQEEEPEPAATVAAPDMAVTLPDGTTATVKDLLETHKLAALTTRASQENADQRRDLETLSTRMTSVAEKLVNDLIAAVPPAPDRALLISNPGLYLQQKEAREEALAQVQSYFELGEGFKETTAALSEADFRAEMDAENVKLAKAMPALSDPVKLEGFQRNVETAAKSFGFTEAEIKATSDSRIRMIVHLAAVGRQSIAERARAKGKVESAAPKLPVKSVSPARQVAARSASQTAAIKRFNANPTAANAAYIDFE